MKKNFLFVFIVILSISSYSQFEITGTVVHSFDDTPLENVKITDTTTKTEVFSDANGKFTIKTFGLLKLEKAGYKLTFLQTYDSRENRIALSPQLNNLDEVVVNSHSIPLKQRNASESITLITRQDINKGNAMELHPILNRVPGVFMQNATLNTNRISIRGIGARNLFGTANIRAYYDDIPLTDGNGESSIEDLELSALSHIEIHKGPSSSSYGVGLGGTIILKPEYTEDKTAKGVLSSIFGSYGLKRILAEASLGLKRSNFNILYSNNHSDGYRNNNKYDRQTLTITSQFDAGEKNKFSLLGSYIDLTAGIPSSLNQVSFNTTPREAAFTWGRSQAFEDVNYGIFGLTWKHQYNAATSHNTSVFSSFRNNYEPRPFNILEEKSNSIGIRSRVLGKYNVSEKELNWTLGGELFFDNYNSKTFENLYENFPIGTGSIRGNQLSDLDEKRYYYNFFAEANYKLNQKLRVNLGVHLNQTFFDIEDQFLSDSINSSGQFDYDPIVSPKFGINYILDSNFTLFGNISHGFSTPTTSETLLPDGVFNPDIKPEVGWNYEIGTRYTILNSRLFGSVSLYTLRVKDLLVSRRTIDDNFFAINAGKTIHNGLEASLNYTLLKFNPARINVFINTTINQFTFDDFIDLDNNFSGNDITGVPSKIFNTGIALATQKGIYGNISFQYVDEIPVNDANSLYSDSYELMHSKIGFKNGIGQRFSYDLSIGVNNIFDTKYASQIQINARGFGGNAPRYFYPGLPFNMYGGINIKYRL